MNGTQAIDQAQKYNIPMDSSSFSIGSFHHEKPEN